ncbi:MAG: hypothetical protein AAF681_03585 [Pseudomonadota bacterium]
MAPIDQLPAIQAFCAGAQLIDERGGKCVFLPDLGIMAGDTEMSQDALFVPNNLLGYGSSRLLYSAQLSSGSGQNWTQHHLVGRTWWAPSFKVPQQPAWRDEILAHLKGVA